MVELPEVNLRLTDATRRTSTGPFACAAVSAGPKLVIWMFGWIVSPGCITGGTSRAVAIKSGDCARIWKGCPLAVLLVTSVSVIGLTLKVTKTLPPSPGNPGGWAGKL